MLVTENTTLSKKQRDRLERFEQMRRNRRGRKNPASVPARLTRTSAFAPKRRGLNTDSNFRRVYIVPKHSVIEVSGRELGSQHRDAMYALFRLQRYPKLTGEPSTGSPFKLDYETRTSWRELLTSMSRSEHTNNLMTLLHTFEDIKKVVITVYEGDPDDIITARKEGRLAGMGGMMGNIIKDIVWDGVDLDSNVTIEFGGWAAQMIQKAHLVSLNADVQFALKSDHAKSFWPYIDSMNNNTFVEEHILAGLAGRDLWADYETSSSRSQFRKDCRQALNDMKQAGGLADWREEITGSGRRKSRRYHYTHALARQMELDLAKEKEEQKS